MRRLNNSGNRSPLGLAPEEVPCVQCHRRVPGLSWGDFCVVCLEERRRKAERLAQRYAIGASVLMGAWLIWKTPPAMPQRIFGAASVFLVYIIVRRTVSRLVQEYLPKEVR